MIIDVLPTTTENGDAYALREPLSITRRDKKVEVPIGFRCDGCSVPEFLGGQFLLKLTHGRYGELPPTITYTAPTRTAGHAKRLTSFFTTLSMKMVYHGGEVKRLTGAFASSAAALGRENRNNNNSKVV